MLKDLLVFQADFAFSERQEKICLLILPGLINPLGELILFESEEERVKICIHLSLSKRDDINADYQDYELNRISLIKLSEERINIDDFEKYACNILLKKNERLKFLLGEYDARPEIQSIIDSDGRHIAKCRSGRISGAIAKFRNPVDLVLVKSKLEIEHSYLDEYIERFNSIMQIRDSLFRLISLVSLMEFIDYTAEEKIHLENPHKNKELKWAWAARNLIAHGVIDKGSSLKPLKNKLGISDEIIVFDRASGSHLNLIKEASRVYAKSIKNFINSSW